MDKINDQVVTDNYSIFNGDSCEVLPQLPDNSIDFSVFSPPFQAFTLIQIATGISETVKLMKSSMNISNSLSRNSTD